MSNQQPIIGQNNSHLYQPSNDGNSLNIPTLSSASRDYRAISRGSQKQQAETTVAQSSNEQHFRLGSSHGQKRQLPNLKVDTNQNSKRSFNHNEQVSEHDLQSGAFIPLSSTNQRNGGGHQHLRTQAEASQDNDPNNPFSSINYMNNIQQKQIATIQNEGLHPGNMLLSPQKVNQQQMFTSASKQNIRGAQSVQIDQDSNSIQGDAKMGKYGKFQINAPVSSYKRQSQSNNDGSSNLIIVSTKVGDVDTFNGSNSVAQSRFAMNQNAQQLAIDASNGTTIRKMSVAAKSGQMQIFNNQNVPMSSVQGSEIKLIYNYQQPGKTDPLQMSTHHLASKQAFISPQIPPNLMVLPVNSSTPMSVGQPQNRESFLSRRQILQQQRDKKQELLNQLDTNGRLPLPLGANAHTISNTSARGANDEIPRSLIQSGSQSNFQQLSSTLGINVTLGNQTNKYEVTLNQGNNGSSGIKINTDDKQSMNLSGQQMYANTSPARFIRVQQQPLLLKDNQTENSSTIAGRRRINALSLMGDVATTNPSSALNTKQQALKNRASELQYIQQAQIDQQQQQQIQVLPAQGISGKQIPMVIAQNEQNDASKNIFMQSNLPQNPVSQFSQHYAQQVQQMQKQQQPQQEYQQPPQSQPVQASTSQSNVNCRITRKLEGGRPHKVYDYMFIQMSNEQFKNDYEGKKIFVNKPKGSEDQYYDATYKLSKKFASPSKSPDKSGKVMFGQGNAQNLNGLVKIKAYDNQMTDELPLMQCNLLPTQMDHVKLLICEQEDKNYPKLTPEAQQRFEIEKQNQIKQYMEDIIIKLQQKERKFKVTVKKKFIDDALYNSTSLRVASVYVIVVNREKTYDPSNLHNKSSRPRKGNSEILESSEEDDDMSNRLRDNLRKSGNNQSAKKKSMYDSDGREMMSGEQYLSTGSNIIPQFKKLLDKNGSGVDIDSKFKKHSKVLSLSNGPNFKSKVKDESNAYKYTTPAKDYPSKYGQTRIKIVQDITQHDHHKTHSINIFFNQYNEFIRLVFKNNKTTINQKFNIPYALGLSRALGLNLKKDAFSEQNMKSREYMNQIKEKLIYCFYKKLNDENKEEKPQKDNNDISSEDIDAGNSIDSTMASNNNNTPKNKQLASKKDKDDEKIETGLVLPHANVIYKYFVGKGNNALMVKSLFKNRYWWVSADIENQNDKCNFWWTQVKSQKIIENLACKFPNKKAGNKNTMQMATFGSKVSNNQESTPLKSNKKKKSQIEDSSNPNINNSKPTKMSKYDITAKFTEQRLYNKIEDNFHVNNKKALFINMKNYYEAMDEDVYRNIPLTFHVKNGMDDPEFEKFTKYYMRCEEEIKNQKARRKELQNKVKQENKETEDAGAANPGAATTGAEADASSPAQQEDINDNPNAAANGENKPVSSEKPQKYYRSQVPPKNIWIIKPGENTNRGQGIQVAKDFQDIKDIIGEQSNMRNRTCILQKYIHNPLLIHRRKFDIRTYAMMTSHNGNLKAFYYEEGYLRTSCREYSMNNLNNKLVHLTNDAVQKRCEDYGKFEPGNKLSFNDFQVYLDKFYPDLNICFERDILPQIHKMTCDVFRACHGKLDPKRRLHCMEVFGLDFMIDDEFKVYLIEVNTNPCLELSSPLLARLIPTMLENAFKIGMDTVFLPPENFSTKKAFIGDACPENRFTLCYDEKIDGPVLDKLFQAKADIIVEMNEEEFSDDEDVHDDDDEEE